VPLSPSFKPFFNPLDAFFQVHQFPALEEMADNVVGRQNTHQNAPRLRRFSVPGGRDTCFSMVPLPELSIFGGLAASISSSRASA
jgi:hypothetical protein